MGIFKLILKSIVGVMVAVLIADSCAIAIDKMLVEVRVYKLKTDMADIASRNNGIPFEYYEMFEDRAQSIVDRSHILQYVGLNIEDEITDPSSGVSYASLGLATDSTDLYESGDAMDIAVGLYFEYQSLMFSFEERVESDANKITISDLGAIKEERDVWLSEASVRTEPANAFRYLK